MSDIKGSTSTISGLSALHKELDEASCPICMDCPHNTVLLLCSSYDKGCRSYICDTSYRHSNCFDRLKNLKVNNGNNSSQQNSSLPRNQDRLVLGHSPLSVHVSNINSGLRVRSELAEGESFYQDPYEHVNNQGVGTLETSGSESVQEVSALGESMSENVFLDERKMNLKCPMCRGTVHGWKIIKEARQYLDLKRRSCSQESCSFIGTYRELRRHARRVHLATRPADIDPSRERAWQQLEHQREHGDVVSAIRSAMPGAIVVGDYVIENGESSELGEGSSPWWSTFFLFQMIRNGSRSSPRRPISQPRSMSRFLNQHRRSSGGSSRQRHVWGDNLEDHNWSLPIHRREEFSRRPRRRRRFTQSRPDENNR